MWSFVAFWSNMRTVYYHEICMSGKLCFSNHLVILFFHYDNFNKNKIPK